MKSRKQKQSSLRKNDKESLRAAQHEGRASRPLLPRFLRPPFRPLPLLLFGALVMLLCTVIAGLIAFGLTIRNLETVKVPNLEKELLVDALLQLQERGLVPTVQLRYFSDPLLKDRVVIHQPGPGAVVRVGRRINLVVSRGVVVDVLSDYVGRQLSDVQLEIQGLFSAFDGILRVGAVSYVFDKSESGLILEQDPDPGTSISRQLDVNFVVSRGGEVEQNEIGNFVGLYFAEAIETLARENISFRFHLIPEEDSVAADAEFSEGVVISQNPPADRILQLGTIVELAMTPVASEEAVFGIFRVDLPSVYAPIDVHLVASYPNGSQRSVFSMKHAGGPLSIPYLEPENTELVFYQLETEVKRLIVRNVLP